MRQSPQKVTEALAELCSNLECDAVFVVSASRSPDGVGMDILATALGDKHVMPKLREMVRESLDRLPADAGATGAAFAFADSLTPTEFKH